MLNTKAYAYDLLTNDAPLVAALGTADKIQFVYPNDFNSLPIITYRETSNRNIDFFDNAPFSDESTIAIDVWANVSTTTLAGLVDDVMLGALYTREYAEDIPDPDIKIFHKSLRYRRVFTADDID